MVQVEGEKPDPNGGGIYYVAVDVRKASLLEKLFPGIHDGATLVPVGNVPPRERTSRTPPLRAGGNAPEPDVRDDRRATGARLSSPDETARRGGRRPFPGYPASGELRGGDLIRAIDGAAVRGPEDVTRVLGAQEARRHSQARDRAGRGAPNDRPPRGRRPRQANRAFIGISVAEVYDVVKLPVDVKIDLGKVGGPSAGLAFALDLMEELGRDVDRGNRVAATGEIALDGQVLPVGGIKQKTIGARRSGMDVFLVPGDNAAEARRYADGMRIVPVDSFQQALRSLATLPAKA